MSQLPDRLSVVDELGEQVPQVHRGDDQVIDGIDGGGSLTPLDASDPIRLGLLIGNAIAAACYGPRGEWRGRRG
jgi:hypothetical protein